MFILFDIGGTHIRVGGTHDLKAFVGEPLVMDTPHLYEDGIKALKEAIEKVREGEDVEKIAGGIAGPLGKEARSLVGSPNLKDWIGKPLCDELEKAFNTEVHIENDSALVGLGEMHHGSGEASGVGAYITVSTGVGGARYVDGVIDRTTIGFEPGHQIIDADKTLCPECVGNTLGNYISGKDTEKRLKKSPKEISQDDPMWDEYAKYLAYGLSNTIVHWSPQVLVLGGSMIVGDPSISTKKVIEYLKETLSIFPQLPEIREAELGSLGGLYGGMVLLSQINEK